MVGIANHGGHGCRCRDDTPRRRDAKQGTAAVCRQGSRLPQDGFIDHPAKHAFRESAWITLRLTNFSPCYRELADAIIERKICSRTGVPTFTEVLLRMNRIRYL